MATGAGDCLLSISSVKRESTGPTPTAPADPLTADSVGGKTPQPPARDRQEAAAPPPPDVCRRCGRPLTLGQRVECFNCSALAYEVRGLPVPEWLQRLAAQEKGLSG
jgi:hypothetical protein